MIGAGAFDGAGTGFRHLLEGSAVYGVEYADGTSDAGVDGSAVSLVAGQSEGSKTAALPPAAQPRPTASSPLFSQIASRWFDIAASVARCREYRAAPQLNASGLLDHTLIA